MKYILAVLQAPWSPTKLPYNGLPRTCTPRSWRPCRAGSGRRRGALGPGVELQVRTMFHRVRV